MNAAGAIRFGSQIELLGLRRVEGFVQVPQENLPVGGGGDEDVLVRVPTADVNVLAVALERNFIGKLNFLLRF